MRNATQRVLFVLAMGWLLLFAQPAMGQKVVDEILAVVNGEIVTRSDLLWSLALDPGAPSPAASIGPDVLKQAFEVIIERKLVAQEASRIPSTAVTREEIDTRRAQLIAGFPSEAAFRERQESVGLTRRRLDRLIEERILIERFVDFRFRSFVFISEQDVQKYYDEVLVPRVREAGQVPPALDAVRDEIETLLKEEKIGQEIDRWLLEARQRAEIVQLAEP